MSKAIPRFPLIACLALLSGAGQTFAQGQVWIVDGSAGPGTDFTTLQPAINAAASGDTVLVRAGFYGSFQASGKALTLAAADAARPYIGEWTGASQITGLPSGTDFTLRGLELRNLQATNNPGTLWIEDCLLSGTPALLVNNCSDLVVAHSTAIGSNGGYCPSYPGPSCFIPAANGVTATNSHLVWLSSTAQGGQGAPETALDPQFPSSQGAPTAGAIGLSLLGGQLEGLRANFLGGAGGSASGSGGGSLVIVCQSGADGGTGLELNQSVASLRASVLSGGPAGQGELCYPFFGGGTPTPTPNGIPGIPLNLLGGSSVSESGVAAPDVIGNSPVREGQNLSLQLLGDPNQVLLLALADPAPSLPLGAIGSLYFDTLLVLDAVQLNGAGQAQRSYPLNQLPGPLLGYTLVVQTAEVIGAGDLALGTALHTLLLDAAY